MAELDQPIIKLSMEDWLKLSLRSTVEELARLNSCYLRLDGKFDVLSAKFIEDDKATNKRITNLYIKMAGLSASVAILTVLVFKYLIK